MCQNKFLESDGYCTQCGKVHRQSRPKRKKPIIVNGEIFKRKPPKRKRIVKLDHARFYTEDELTAMELGEDIGLSRL